MHLGISILMAQASAAAARSGAAVHHLWISPSDKLPIPEVRSDGVHRLCVLSSWLLSSQQAFTPI